VLRPTALTRFDYPLERQAWRMLAVHAAYTAANLFAATFLSIFIWRAHHDLGQVCLFNAVYALGIPIAFLANGWFFRRADAGTSIRRGLLTLTLLYVLVLLLGNASSGVLVLVGALRGLGEGWYWAGYHLVTYDAISRGNRDRYFGAMGAAGAFLGVSLPPLAGTIIVLGMHGGGTYGGYQVTFGVAAATLLAAALLAGGLHAGSRRGFSLVGVFRLPHRNPAWSYVTWARLVDGSTGFVLGMVVSILTFVTLRNEQNVGGFNAVVGLLTVGLSLGLGLWLRPRHRMRCALLGGSLLVASTLVYPLYLSVGALLLFGLLRALGGPLHGNALAPVWLQVIDRDPQAPDLRYEYIVSQELTLGIGRVLSVMGVMVLATPIDQLTLARVVLVVAGAAPILIWASFARIPGPVAEPRPLHLAA
jgi:MFS transporter, YQGE family, putative transporter